MAYEFDGDNLLACQDIANQLFNMLLDENGNFLALYGSILYTP